MSKIRIENVRLSFPDLFVASEFEGSDSGPKYKAAFIVEPGSASDKLIRQSIEDVAKEKWGAKHGPILKAALSSGPKETCYYSGDLKEYDGYAGSMVLGASRSLDKGRPGVYDADRSPLAQEDGKPYAGCYVNAIVELWAQDNKFGKTIRATLVSVQFVRGGDAFSAGSAPSEDDFDDLAAGAGASDLI